MMKMKQSILGQTLHTIKFDGKYEVTLVDCILKNAYDILRKDRTYDQKVGLHDWPLVTEEWDRII